MTGDNIHTNALYKGDVDQEKAPGYHHHVEDVDRQKLPNDGQDRHLAVKIPDSLIGLTDDEVDVIDRAATRKLDMLLMPILCTLYILNYLDRQSELIWPGGREG